MDLREEIGQIINQYGYFALLQRSSRKIRCICWDEKYQESSVENYYRHVGQNAMPGQHNLRTCPRCLGKGWVSRIERHKLRADNASQVIALPQLIQQMPVGQLASDARVFYMMHDTHPRKGDFVYEVGWDRHKPTHLIQAYEINSSEGLRGEGGRIEYYQVVCKEANLATPVRQFTIRRLGPLKNYEAVY